jgi:hypothetical protein
MLRLDPKTVRSIIENEGKAVSSQSKNRIEPDSELIRRVYHECNRYGQRTYEVLTSEYGLEISYPTLMRRIDELGLSPSSKKKQVAVDAAHLYSPGEEFQHDTSPFQVFIGGKRKKVTAAAIYFRYSKIRYVRFYYTFDRFAMKGFFYEALRELGYVASVCIIDNTSLAVIRGSGANAVIAAEMKSLAKLLGGFQWKAHEIGHSDRKAGKERNFRSLNQNFFPGRTFHSLEDLNQQVRSWALEHYARRPQSKTKLIPAELFEHEKLYLTPVPADLPPPQQQHWRKTDNYGYISMHGNYYLVPRIRQQKKLQVIEYPGEIHIYDGSQWLIQYALAQPEMKNEKFTPPDYQGPRKQSRRLKKAQSTAEQKKLRSLGSPVTDYIDWILKGGSRVKQRHHFIRKLYQLSASLSPSLFRQTIQRAYEYNVDEIASLERIAFQLMQLEQTSEPEHDPEPELHVDENYRKRMNYQQGRFCQEPDLFSYTESSDLKSNNSTENES